MDCEIRPMTAQELPAVAALERACFSHPWSEQSLSASLHNGRSVFLTAHGAAGLLGYLGMEYVRGEGSVTNVAVFPEYRRRGVAGQLLKVFCDFAAGRHLAFLTLEVRPSNEAAIALYQSFGFTERGRRRNYYDLPREDALILTRDFGEEANA